SSPMGSMRRPAKRSGQELGELLEGRLRTLATRRPVKAFIHARAGVGSRRPMPETGFRHVADRYELFFAVEGEARIVTPQRVFRVVPGELLIIDPGVDHEEIPATPPTHYEAFWVAVNGTLAQVGDSVYAPEKSYRFGPRLLLTGNTDIESIVTAISAELACREWGWLTCVNCHLRYLSCMLTRRVRRLSANRLRDSESLTISADPRVWRAIRGALRLCEANLSRTLRVADVAAAVGYSPDHLSRLFARYLGSSFSVHLDAMRITAAKGLLEDRDLSVREVAQSVGYTHASNFSHAFARATGLSPREYRRHLAGQ
ncbi:MAG: AraC family transcriptional regulator, partial [Actinobacteria bacterium]|nr:AraC family transcriptional regulator [Actinomycetota bacterium]